MLEILLVTVFPAAIAYAAISDMFTMTIPNRISIVLAGAFFVLAPLAGVGLEQMAMHVLAALLVLAAGIFMFARGWIGGGDAKMFAAATLWFGFEMLGPFTLLTAVAGGFLSLALLMFRRVPLPVPILRMDWVGRLYDVNTGVPYGIAIAVGALMAYPKTPWIAAVL